MPQACTLIRTVPAPGSGICRSTISKGPPGRATCTTRMVAMVPPVASGRSSSLVRGWVAGRGGPPSAERPIQVDQRHALVPASPGEAELGREELLLGLEHLEVGREAGSIAQV